jgi:putative peptidoglycan lipid II flippase
MMWAPIANNVISVAVLLIYLVVFGPARGAAVFGGFTTGQELLLGIGSTIGIAAQFLILLPYLRATGFYYRPQFDFRGTGLGHTLRLGVWTVWFVIVNQVAYTVVVRLASGGTASAVDCSGSQPVGDATGYTVYASTFLIMMVPHSIVTVSLATAILPGLSARAASGDRDGLSGMLTDTLRSALAIVVPFALLLPLIATDVSNVIWGHGAAADRYQLFAPSLALFGPGLVFFTVHYLMLRGFYAIEHNRTVFWIQCAVAGTNIVAALVLVRATDPEHTSPALVVAYTASYVVGATLSYVVLRRLLGDLRTPRLVRFLVRMILIALVSTAVAGLAAYALHRIDDQPSWPIAAVWAASITAVDIAVFVVLAKLVRLREVTSVIDTVLRRLPLPRRS